MIEPKITKEVQQQLDEIHANVVKAKKQIKTVWYAVAGLTVVLFALGYFSANPFFFFAIFAGLIGGSIAHSHLNSKSNARFKADIITKVINEDKALGIQYFYDQSISVAEFEASKIFQRYVDKYSGEDLFVGAWGKTKFKFSEIEAEEKNEHTDAQGHKSTDYETIFEGIMFIAEFHKNLKGITRVIEGKDGFFEKLFAGNTKVNLENPAFEKIYNTYSDNQVEARYILTPDMMERMLKLREKFKSKVEFSFLNNLVFIAIHSNKDKFELDRKKPVDKTQIKRVFAEIDSFIQIIDMLNLNLHIWGEVE